MMFGKYAFDLSKSKSYPLEDCFKYAESLYDYGGTFDEDIYYEDKEDPDYYRTPEERMRIIGDKEVNQKVFFERGIPVESIIELLDDHAATEDDLMKCNSKMLRMYPGFDDKFSMSFKYYLQAYEYYEEHYCVEEGEDDEDLLYYYVSLLQDNLPMEIAFEEALYRYETDKDIKEHSMDYSNSFTERDDEYDPYESEIEEENRWKQMPRIDDDLRYDPENVGYDDDYDPFY